MANASGLLPRYLGAALLCGVFSPASADVLSFDDLPTATAPFASAYQGFMFGSEATGWLHSTATSIFYVPHSGQGYAVADSSLSTGDILEDGAAISRVNPFIFEGAWFSGINQVRYTLFLDGVQVYLSSDSPELPRTSSLFVPSGYGGLITSVVVSGRQGFFAMDDFTFTTPVPELDVSSMLVLGLSALAVHGLYRRRRAT